jgi:hypothetical protein
MFRVDMLRRHSLEALATASVTLGASTHRCCLGRSGAAPLATAAELSSFRRVARSSRSHMSAAGSESFCYSGPIMCHHRCQSSGSASPSSSKEAVLSVWNRTGSSTQRDEPDTKPAPSKALQFVLGNAKRAVTSVRKPMESTTNTLGKVQTEPAPMTACSPNDVAWVMCERMDFHLHYAIPSGWLVREIARENHIAIQCFPPPPAASQGGTPTAATASAAATTAPRTGASFLGSWGASKPEEPKPAPPPPLAHSTAPLHGISMNCFAYHRKVDNPSSDQLMETFLKRFATTCEGGVVNVVRSSAKQPQAQPAASPATTHDEDGASLNWTETISSQIGGSVCEITFEPRRPPTSSSSADEVSSPPSPATAPSSQANPSNMARGLCRAFYNNNRRFHYIMLAVVPDAEFATSERLLAHTLMHFGATKTTGMASL